MQNTPAPPLPSNLVSPFHPFCLFFPFCFFFLAPLPPLAPGCPSPASFLPLTSSGFFNGMLVVFEPRALNCYIFFRPIPLTLSVFRNLISTHLSLSRSLDFLLCGMIAPTPSLAFSLLIPRTLAAASSFLSGRAYPFQNFVPPLFLCLTPTLIL